jgi:hypothetical protein
MVSASKLSRLREVITENLRVQRDGESIEYVNVGTALNDAKAKQNHAIFARRGCGKTLLLHHSTRMLPADLRSVYLNCEDFKKHSFPNVLIEILAALFRELDRNLNGWFGKKKKTKEIIKEIILKLAQLKRIADEQSEEVVSKSSSSNSSSFGVDANVDIEKFKLGANYKEEASQKEEIERSFNVHRQKLKELDEWLPVLKEQVREFFKLSKHVKGIFLQIDDLYHLKRTDQAFVVDYIHRLCKDVPLYFKIATLRHASTLYADREGQPIGAQERHDYQPINIDYTFSDFGKTREQNWQILLKFGDQAAMSPQEIGELFKGAGFSRLVMAGGGVPRDVLSLFLEVMSNVDVMHGDKIGKDEVRILSRANFERRIEELKQDSKADEQDDLIRGIYIIRKFCLDRKTNIFAVREQMLQQNDGWRALFYRLMDYRIVHSCATALTHKSQDGTYQAFAIDIGCYAHLRKLQDRFTEIDVSESGAKERMRSAPVLEKERLDTLFKEVPKDVEAALLSDPG